MSTTSSRRRPSLDPEQDPYPPSIPRPALPRSSSSLANLSKEEIRERERLVNEFEAEEEMIMNKLGRRLEELKQHSHQLSLSMEAESESIVNRLQRQLRVVEAQLAAATAENGNGIGGGVVNSKSRPCAPYQSSMGVGLQTFLSGSDPVIMGNVVEGLRAEKVQMQHKIDALSNDNDNLRQELISLRSRLHIPVDDLIGLAPPPRQSTPTAAPPTHPSTTQPISFARPLRPTTRQHSPPQTRTSSSTTTTSSSPDPAGISYTSHTTGLTSYSPSYSSYPLPQAPQNTFTSPLLPAPTGLPLTYPSVPPPSLATSLASTAAVSPVSSPTHSRRPSQGAGGRIAEQGTFARGRVESFGTGLRRVERERGGVVEEEREG